MSSMTQKANSDYSYPESDYGDVKSQISKVHERLVAVLQEEAQLRQSLEELFDKQEAEALEELRKAEQNLKSIREEREVMRFQLKDKESPTENHQIVQDSAKETESLVTLMYPNSVSVTLIGNQEGTLDQDQRRFLPVEDLRAQPPTSKYGDNKIALALEAEMKAYELQVECFKRIVEETEHIAEQWSEIKDTDPLRGIYRTFVVNKYDPINKGMEKHLSSMRRAEYNAAIIRDILANFEESREARPDIIKGSNQ